MISVLFSKADHYNCSFGLHSSNALENRKNSMCVWEFGGRGLVFVLTDWDHKMGGGGLVVCAMRLTSYYRGGGL